MHPPSFDAQASDFDLRAGLPGHVAVAVGEAVAAHAPGCGTVLEVGAGTGQLGVEICRRVDHYIALDESSEMLARLRRRLGDAGLPGHIVQGDARTPWPVRAGTLRVVFGSRFWHWLDPDAAIAQVRRLLHPGGCALLVGRVARDPLSHKEQVRSRLLGELGRRGLVPPAGERGRRLLSRAVEAGGMPVARVRVASWTRTSSPRDSLDAWRTKRHLAGMPVPASIRDSVLDDLERWTRDQFGNIDTALPVQETYILEGARFHGP